MWRRVDWWICTDVSEEPANWICTVVSEEPANWICTDFSEEPAGWICTDVSEETATLFFMVEDGSTMFPLIFKPIHQTTRRHFSEDCKLKYCCLKYSLH